jgi:flagellar biosynthetic protein FlhB
VRLDLFAERSEPATPRRRQRARREGQVAVSRELTAAVALFALALYFQVAGPTWVGELASDVAGLLALPATTPPAPALGVLGQAFVALTAPALLAAFVMALLVGVGQTGLLFRPAALLPDFGRLNPFAGLARLFSRQAAGEALKALVKLVLLVWLAWSTLGGLLPSLLAAAGGSVAGSAQLAFAAAAGLSVKLAGAYLLLAGADYAVQRARVEARLRMTRAEIREELRETEGSPEVRRRIRQRQRRATRQRMMAAVRTATVVVTNPVHLAVALRYVHGVTLAPTVVAKGRGYVALRLKEEARAHGVEIVENAPLAQALYRSTEVGDAIPPELYRAVAELLAVIFRKRGGVS